MSMFRKFGQQEWQKHAMTHPWIGTNASERIEHPICPHCEKIALRDVGWTQNRKARCPACGWSGQATLLMREYVQEELYRR